MAKRNYVCEILEMQTRLGKSVPYINVLVRLRDIQILVKDDDVQSEVIKYCPVALVSCIEAYFREVIKTLIDFGAPYKENAEKFDRTTFDYRSISAIQDNKVTIGDLISHLASLNNLNCINTNMTKLLNEDFMKLVKNEVDDWPWESGHSVQKEKIISNPDVVFSDIKKVFQLRNIVCHEFALPIVININDARRYIKSIETFLSSTNFLITRLLFKDIPDAQQERNIYFCEKYKETEKLMSEALIRAEKAFEGNRLVKFKELQEFWEEYRKQEASFISSSYEGGSIQPQIHAQRMEQLTKQRIKTIEFLIESEKP